MTRDTKKIKLTLVLVFNFSVDWKNCQRNGKNILMKSYSCFVKEIHIKESDILFLKISIGKDTQGKCKQILGRGPDSNTI